MEQTPGTNNASKDFFDEIDIYGIIKAYLKGLRAYFWIIPVTIVLLSSVLCFVGKKTHNPIYQSRATFVVSIKSFYGESSSSFYNATTAQLLADTFPEIIKSGVLSDIVADDLGYEKLPAVITADATEETNLFTITVSTRNAELSHKVLESIIENYPKIADFVVGDTTLELLEDSGVAVSPANRFSYTTQIKFGTLIGLVLSLGLIAAMVFSRITIRDLHDAKRTLNIKCLASIPIVIFKKRTKNIRNRLHISNTRIMRGYRDAIRLLSLRVEKTAKEKGAKVVLVTSTIPGEGKTTVSSNLAAALSHRGHKVVIIDCDLRNPSVNDLLAIPREKDAPDLIDYLNGEIPINKIYVTSSEGITIFSAQKSVRGSASELCGSDEMGRLIGLLSDTVDFVILDTPPISMFSDAMALSRFSDASLYVIKQDYASKSRVIDGISKLSSGNKPFLGYVLNATDDASYENADKGRYNRYTAYGRYGRYGHYGRYSGGYGYGGYGYGGSYDSYGSSHRKSKKKDKYTSSNYSYKGK